MPKYVKDLQATIVTPRLRFPDFRNAEGWEEKTFEDLVSQVVRERVKPAVPYTGLGVRSHGKGTFLKPEEPPEKNAMECLYEVATDDLIVNITFAWEGAIAIAQATDHGALVSHRFPTYTFNKRSAMPDFFRYSISDKRLIYKLGVISPGGAGRNRVLNKRDFLKLTRFTPSIAEQRKIVECLTSLDELIDAQGRKVEALKAHKKGLMQQLFPREGESLPRLRFPQFSDAPEWNAAPFEAFVARSFYGTSNSTSEKGEYPVLRMGNMIDGRLDFSNIVYINLDRESFEGIRLIRGDILLNRTNSLDLVGKISMFDGDMDCITASYIVTYRLEKDRIDPTFCNFMLNTPLYQAKIKALARPSISQANINPTTFRKELVVSVPRIAEQRQIAACLSAVDAQITTESEKLDVLKTHKKGLMQQLFPTGIE